MRQTHHLPSYSFGGHEVFDTMAHVISPYGTKVAIIGGIRALSVVETLLKAALNKGNIEILEIIPYSGECTFTIGKELSHRPSVKEADLLIAVGGGKVIDTVKVVALELDDKPFITVPTIAATCAATSEAAAVYKEDHTFDGIAFVHHPPLHCFIDSQILVEAPPKYLWAGMGDTIAKHYETHMSARGRERVYNTQLGLALSSMCAEPIFKQGVQALEDNRQQVRTTRFDELVMAVIFTTGVVSGCMPGDYNSIIAHAICYGCASHKETEAHHLHGEMVAYGLLVLFAVDKQEEELQRWLPVYKQMGWPTKLKDLGLGKENIPQIIEKALSCRDVVISPYEITAEILEEGIHRVESL